MLIDAHTRGIFDCCVCGCCECVISCVIDKFLCFTYLYGNIIYVCHQRWWGKGATYISLVSRFHKLYYNNKYASPWIRWDRILDASMTFFFRPNLVKKVWTLSFVLLHWCLAAVVLHGKVHWRWVSGWEFFQEGFWLLGEWKGVNREETWGWHGARNQGKGVIN